jgi:hypothetical protein
MIRCLFEIQAFGSHIDNNFTILNYDNVELRFS